MKLIKQVILLSVIIWSCKESKQSEVEVTNNDIHEIVVKEVLHVSEYSYIKGVENTIERWIAAPLVNVEVDRTYYYQDPMKMNDFESKALGRRFETIYFVNNIRTSKDPNTVVPPLAQPGNPHSGVTDIQNLGTKPVVEKKAVKIAPAENTITIAELLEQREQLKNKTVHIKGQVTKYNPTIMNVNWLHLQDGTDFKGAFDLTVTTLEEVAVGDIVTVEGVVILNKDFGAGYYYETILENAKLIK